MSGRCAPFAPGLLDRLSRPVRKVAVVRPSRLGDLICATPALRALRAALPEAEIVLITLPLLRDLALRLPPVDRYVAFPGFVGIAEQFFDARRALQFFADMQAEHFDLALQLYGSGVYANPVTLMLGAGSTAGFVQDGTWSNGLNAALPWPQRGHEVGRLLALTAFLGAPPGSWETDFPLWLEDHAAAGELLDGAPRPLIGLHPGSWQPDHCWAPERFAAAGAALRRHCGGTLLVLGGPQERALAQAVADRAGPPCLNLAGRTPLAVLGAVVARLALLLANDSGLAHLAYALRTPTVAVFGGPDPARYGPPVEGPWRIVLGHGVTCRSALDFAQRPVEPAGLDAITADEVVAAALDVFAPPTLLDVPDDRQQSVKIRVIRGPNKDRSTPCPLSPS